MCQMLLPRWVIATTSLAVSLVVLLAGAPSARGATLSTLTYNVQGLTDVAPGDPYHMSQLKRGEAIGKNIKKRRYDVVALNELFDDTVRSGVKSALIPSYPVRISKIDGNDAQDSGLALFSRLPLETFGNARPQECRLGGGSTGKCRFAFHVYDACANIAEDCISAKGIGLVRVKPKGFDGPVDVFFTHTQADEDESVARGQQVEEARKFIDAFTGKGTAVLLGDLNIIGGSKEWLEQIAAGGFHDVSLFDTWNTEATVEDPGLTLSTRNTVMGQKDDIINQKEVGERLDYTLLRNRPKKALCPQHPMVERGFRTKVSNEDGASVEYVQDLSDHFAVSAVLGYRKGFKLEGCSPRRARTIQQQQQLQAFALPYAGGYQWFRVNDGGTYRVRVDGPDGVAMQVQAYDVRDISTPLKAVSHTTREIVFDPDGPFLIRVAAPKVKTGGGTKFKIRILKAQGASFADAIWLKPYVEERVRFAPFATGPNANRLWFKFRTERLTSGAKQELRFTAKGLTEQARLGLFRFSSVATPVAPASPFAAPEVTIDGDALPAEGAEHVLIAERGAATPAEFTIGWTTNLFTVRLFNLKCREQEDGFTEDDTIRLHSIVDGVKRPERALGDFDPDDHPRDVDMTFKVAEQLDVALWEIDGTVDSAGGDIADHDEYLGLGQVFPPEPDKVPGPDPANPNRPKSYLEFFADEAARYEMVVQVSRTPP